MNYNVEGTGETLVFIHGLSDNLLYWEFLASNLKKNFQIVRYDLRGHGDSPMGDDEISMETYVNDLTNLLDELDIDKANFIGFSLGGAIALDFAFKYPQKVSSMALMSSFAKSDNHLQNIFNQFTNALNIGFEEFYDVILPMVLCPNVIDENRQDLEMLKEISAPDANVDAYIKAVNACSDFDVEGRLCEIRFPVLILAGKYDVITTPESQKSIYEKISDSDFAVFDEVRHNLLVGKNNGEVLKVLKKFLKNEKK